MKLFDAHCHLQLPQYKDDLPDVLARMQELDMGAVVVGTDYATSKAGVELARQHDFLWAAVGLHPNDNLGEQFDISNYEQLAQNPKVVAIGECGLDYFRSGSTDAEKQKQKERFEAHIALAQKLNKALIIHCREAHDDCISILQTTAIATHVPVVIHFFTGTAELARQYLNLGCYLSFPGPVTFTSMYDDAIRACPLDRILAETDAPFAAPAPYRGKRNEPSYVVEVVKKIAALKNMTVEDMGVQIVLNAQKVFGVSVQ